MYTDDSLSTFSNSTYQELGRRTFWFFVSQRVVTGICFLFLALVLSVARAEHVVPVQAVGTLRLVSWAFFAIALIALLTAFISSRLLYKSSGFMCSDDSLRIKRGIMTIQEVAIPYRQIQNIEIERTFRQRMLGLSRLVIYTASRDDEGGSKDLREEGVIPSIDEDIAVRLQNELLKRANVQKVVQITG
ncbi:MAG: PH domain-containing protein [Candidatus Paceibacterota bacterium]|jgi:membrane protein YdbS with pleckstrin-like domain